MIDTTRTVVLLGYGDGLLHEDDPLTRAQLATIVFRLLDDASIARYSNTYMYPLRMVSVRLVWPLPMLPPMRGMPHMSE